jgi:hypothetical protein
MNSTCSNNPLDDDLWVSLIHDRHPLRVLGESWVILDITVYTFNEIISAGIYLRFASINKDCPQPRSMDKIKLDRFLGYFLEGIPESRPHEFERDASLTCAVDPCISDTYKRGNEFCIDDQIGMILLTPVMAVVPNNHFPLFPVPIVDTLVCIVVE